MVAAERVPVALEPLLEARAAQGSADEADPPVAERDEMLHRFRAPPARYRSTTVSNLPAAKAWSTSTIGYPRFVGELESARRPGRRQTGIHRPAARA